ncbi:tocopherol cyclase family protein [Spirochaeta dissipatitropha]
MGIVRRIWNPQCFQGVRKKKSYFEGWYHKQVSAAGGISVSVICGLAYDEQGRGEAFIQYIQGKVTHYIPYPVQDFRWSKKDYEVFIGPNRFSKDGILLHIDRDDCQIEADLRYSSLTDLADRRLFSPGIMGWYRFVPKMECYHGVISLDHDVFGSISLNGNSIDMNGGRGYIEKDWGSSMPQSWVWFQTNSFSSPGHSVMFSLAHIPWMGKSFPGFLAVCHTPKTQQRFTTYNKSRITSCTITEKKVQLQIRNSEYILNIEADRESAGTLIAPVQGSMSRPISESIEAKARVKLTTLDGYIVFEDIAKPAGLEIVGDTDILLTGLKK